MFLFIVYKKDELQKLVSANKINIFKNVAIGFIGSLLL